MFERSLFAAEEDDLDEFDYDDTVDVSVEIGEYGGDDDDEEDEDDLAESATHHTPEPAPARHEVQPSGVPEPEGEEVSHPEPVVERKPVEKAVRPHAAKAPAKKAPAKPAAVKKEAAPAKKAAAKKKAPAKPAKGAAK